MNNNEYKPDEEELSIANEVVDARIHYPKDMIQTEKDKVNATKNQEK